jgi:type IV secretion system protein VirB9
MTRQFAMSGTGSWVLFACLVALPAAEPALSQEMTALERKALQQSGQWQTGQGIVGAGDQGKVVFVFGESQPSIICAPLQICDIELEPRETVKDVLLGDSVRWSVEAASSGEGSAQTIHLIIRPTEAGLVTSMVVTTSKRTYHIRLRSHESRYMARIGFSYPGLGSHDLAAINARLTDGEVPESRSPLDFRYRITGSARWRPERVYHDGNKTYIQFPRAVKSTEMPVLFLLSEGERQIVNYRVNNQTMIIDHQIERAVLVSGVGWRQKKITITRGG